MKFLEPLWHRLTVTIILLSLLVFILSFVWVSDLFLNMFGWGMNFSSLVVLILIMMPTILLAGLPADYYYYRKDRKICESEGISYYDFIRMERSKKEDIYEKHAPNSD